ncbi:MAG TPA: choice-of-anchor Q domain-containing protein [Candidatus Baltobacteraceae bacterium]|jgi:hypothetical protein
MRRLLSLGFAFLVACSGGPGGTTLTPSALGTAPDVLSGRHRAAPVSLSMRLSIPHHRRRDAHQLHRNTISPLTLSVSVADNGKTPKVFNTTPSSKNCALRKSELICAFQIFVSGGKNTLVVKTYSATNAGGFVLDQATAVYRVTSTTKSVGIILGPVISNANDSGPGSLRQGLADANPGDTLLYVGTTPATITLTGGAVALPKNVTIAGPGAGKLTISANNAGQAFTIGSSVTATISGVTITKGTSSTNGGAIDNAGTLTLSDDTFSSSTATTAGGAVENAGVMTSTSNTYSGNTALHGGAIDNTGSLTATSDTFSGNNAVGAGVGPSIVNAMRPAKMPKQRHLKRLHPRGRAPRHAPQVPKQVFPPDHMRPHPAASTVPNGGAIYNGAAGTIDITNAAFTGNGAQQGDGGAVSSANSAAGWTIANDTFTNNSAAYGGAVGVDTAGTLTSDTFTTNGGYPGDGATIPPYGFGAGVYAQGALTVTNCIFNGNVAGGGTQAFAYGFGGAIEADNAALTVSGSTFKNNVAGGASSSGSTGEGGAIDTTSLSALAVSITNSTFTGNIAGGGSAGTSYGYGGAINTEAYNTLALNGSTFTSNTAGGDGYGNGGAIFIQADLNGGSDTFSKNAATGTSASQNVFGGAIDTNSTIELNGSTFSQNTASGGNGPITAGGAIYTSNTLTLDSDTFTSNAASGPGAASVAGGAIQGTSGMTITNSKFNSNSATAGAGGFADGGGVFDPSSSATISGTTFTSNTVTGGAGAYVYGGGAEVDAPGTSLTNVTFSNNVATASGALSLANGGALYLIGTSTISNGTFTNNSATTPGDHQGWGGAVNAGTLTFSGSVTGNSATNQGGGIFVGGLTMTNSTVSGNNVTAAQAVGQPTPDGGGGLYLVGSHTFTISGSTISGNSVAGSGTGGGILNTSNGSPGTLTLTNDTIANNTSPVDGGGLEDLGSTSSLVNTTMYGNTAQSGNGGNWNNSTTPTSPDSLTNSVVGGGTAGGTGPDIYNNGTLNSGDYNIMQTTPTPIGIFSPPPHDQTANPGLSALASNGGPTKTMADSNTSPGYNTIPIVTGSCNNSGVTTDQRGNARPGTGHANCDAGAYEYP